MLRLIYKDLAVQKREKTPLVAVILAIVSAFTLQKQLGWSVGIFVMTVYLFVVYANAFDYKYNGEILVNSLPVGRRTVVAAKYASVYFLSALVMAGTLVIGLVMKTIGVPTIDRVLGINVAVVTVFVISVYYSVFFPLYFKLGYMKARWVNYLALLAVMFMAGLMNHLAATPLEGAPPTVDRLVAALTGNASATSNIVMLAIAALFIAASYGGSQRIYAYKEF